MAASLTGAQGGRGCGHDKIPFIRYEEGTLTSGLGIWVTAAATHSWGRPGGHPGDPDLLIAAEMVQMTFIRQNRPEG